MPTGIYKREPWMHVRERRDPFDRMMAMVRKTRTCWLWQGWVNNKGYGMLGYVGDKKTCALVHRIAFAKANPRRDIENLLVLHRCDVRRCVNPKHLFAGTAQQNTDDMMKKGRWVLPRHITPRRWKGARYGDRKS